MKGEEAKVAVEELVAQQRHKDPSEGGAPNEQALMSQIVQLERELRDRDQMIEGLRERGSSPAPGAVNEARVLRQENEDLKVRCYRLHAYKLHSTPARAAIFLDVTLYMYTYMGKRAHYRVKMLETSSAESLKESF